MSGRPRLRALRLVGFKSFAEKTVLEFGPGISAVIGPNGSGKSNLADALRWALGEQGRSLRTRRSEDVIFAGSATRHATGMADVSLLIENADRLLPVEYAEVDLGRRLYRSGENEYLLNRQRVRLRDLVDLLDAANLADNAFLFIGQGMVDQALSLRPEERRPLFEEAAGVRRHERRRRQAEDRLAEAEANLARVRDILGELRPQARRLATQAEQQLARRDAARELAEALVAVARARWTAAVGGADQTRAMLVRARHDADVALRLLTAAEDAAADIARALADRHEIVRAARGEAEAARLRVTELRLAEGRAGAEIAAAERERAGVATEAAALVARLTEARRALALPAFEPDHEAEAELAALDAELAAAGREVAAAEGSRRAEGEREASLRRARAASEAEAELLRRRAAEAARRAGETRRSLKGAEAASATAVERLRTAGGSLTAALLAEAQAERAVRRAGDLAAAAEARRSTRAARAAALDERLAGLRARLATIESLLSTEEGSALLAAARRRGGQRVAEGLDVEPSMRSAVEAALGETIRAASVPASVAAALRDERGHLVLSDVAAATPRERDESRLIAAARAAGGGPLGDGVRRDPAGHVSRLLSTVAWVPDLDAALGLLALLPSGWRVVTVAGEVVTADGVVTLGRPDPVLGQRAERERLKREVESLSSEAEAARSAMAAATREASASRKAAEAAVREHEAARRERRGAEERERSAARDAEQAGRELAWEQAQLERLDGDAERTATAARDAADRGTAPGADEVGSPSDASLAAWRRRVDELAERRIAIAATADAAAQAQRSVEDRRRRAEIAATLDEERLATLERAAAAQAEAVEATTTDRARAASALAAARDDEAGAVAKLASLETAESGERGRLLTLEAEAAAAREGLRRAEERARAAEVVEIEARVGLESVRESLLVELAGLGPVGLSALRAGGVALEAMTGSIEVEDDAFAAELEAGLEVAIASWGAGPTADGGPAAAPADGEAPGPGRLALLRRRYHELGASNPFAAEEFVTVRDRLDDLEAQQDDLLSAIGATRQLIAELSQRIAEQFQATFAALEGAFARRFQQLFGGGEASLLLTEPEAPGQGGVEIMARPPGKKRQALAMLSGGERALTAVALLFAMLEVRPVPFCVLDEVDAALDEANVTRFARALQELATSTQCIVITHNRGTIEAADALYGVTLGDDAVSRVISLRLDEATELAASAAG